MKFKLNLPKQCPPKEAEPVDLNPVYRLIKGGNDIRNDDLLSHVEKGMKFPPNAHCEAHAISIFKSKEGCEKLQRKHLGLKKKKIYKGRITKKCGVVDLYRGKDHLNLWVYDNVDLLSIFKKGGKII
ncbi:hypothetical protein [Staphylococcus hominis]|uniref:hypothetical protein n=1 Tax=Staphylococcus hominis TaxID=1290 RepID=UPI003ACA6A6D